jgi:two-component system, cell cycle sensor histidine kinase and response regulator CckA
MNQNRERFSCFTPTTTLVVVFEKNMIAIETLDEKRMAASKTILIIDDEKSIRTVSHTMLKRLGYRVLEAETGKKAIEIIRKQEDRIDLALLDVFLPDMCGGDLYVHLLGVRPDLKVVVCSGYNIDGKVEQILTSGAQGFIQKPYSMAELSEKLSNVLS